MKIEAKHKKRARVILREVRDMLGDRNVSIRLLTKSTSGVVYKYGKAQRQRRSEKDNIIIWRTNAARGRDPRKFDDKTILNHWVDGCNDLIKKRRQGLRIAGKKIGEYALRRLRKNIDDGVGVNGKLRRGTSKGAKKYQAIKKNVYGETRVLVKSGQLRDKSLITRVVYTKANRIG